MPVRIIEDFYVDSWQILPDGYTMLVRWDKNERCWVGWFSHVSGRVFVGWKYRLYFSGEARPVKDRNGRFMTGGWIPRTRVQPHVAPNVTEFKMLSHHKKVWHEDSVKEFILSVIEMDKQIRCELAPAVPAQVGIPVPH
jgi:hypothetical protein